MLLKTLAWTSLKLRVQGESMKPLLHPGDQIVVVPNTPEELAPGDVILLDGLPSPVVHRFMYLSPQGLITKGDASSYDFPWHESHLLGRVVERIRSGQTTRLDEGWPRLHGRLHAFLLHLRHRVGKLLPWRSPRAQRNTHIRANGAA
ncbi:MAG: S24/S26 family peptidase [Planctomycetota bacterium]